MMRSKSILEKNIKEQVVFTVNQGHDTNPVDSYWQNPAYVCLHITYSVTVVEIHVVSQFKN